jgi:Zn-dependent protease
MRGLPLGKAFGIPIELNGSWFLVFAFITFSLARGVFPQALPDRSDGLYWVLGAVSAVLFFAGIVAHELGHALMARRLNVPTQRITLFFFGGVAQLEGNPKSGRAEVLIAAAGPLVSFVLAAAFWLGSSIPGLPTEAREVCAWLARINLAVAVFNLLPAFPLDGGRLLRGAVWARSRSLERGTAVATGVGRLISFGLIAFGAFEIIRGDILGGLWVILLAFFIQGGASLEVGQAKLEQTLDVLPNARGLAQGSWPKLQPHERLDAVGRLVLETGRRAFPVISEDDRYFGLVSLEQLRGVGQERWSWLMVDGLADARTPSLKPETTALEAAKLLSQFNLQQMPVLEDGRYLGMVSRDQITALMDLYGPALMAGGMGGGSEGPKPNPPPSEAQRQN